MVNNEFGFTTQVDKSYHEGPRESKLTKLFNSTQKEIQLIKRTYHQHDDKRSHVQIRMPHEVMDGPIANFIQPQSRRSHGEESSQLQAYGEK